MIENFKIINEQENALFKRKEIQISVDAEITPSHEDVKKLICEKFSTEPEKIKIKKISGKFGSKNFTINVNIYSSKKDRDIEIVNSSKAKKQEVKKESQ